MPTLQQLAAAITRMEGFHPGTRAYRNNNPGNLRFANQPDTIGPDRQGFAIFGTPQAGLAALLALLAHYKAKFPGWTLDHLINVYAPASENDSENYVRLIAQFLAVDPNLTLGEFES